MPSECQLGGLGAGTHICYEIFDEVHEYIMTVLEATLQRLKQMQSLVLLQTWKMT